MITYIKGDIRDAKGYIGHGVNCKDVMGSGVAKAIYTKWPKVKEYFHLAGVTGHNKLGHIQAAPITDGIVFNLFTQEFYGYDGKRYVSYDAIAECFETLLDMNISEISIPMIGCGLAGGNWEIVSRIIEDIVGTDMKVNVYMYDEDNND